jgi:flagellar protein FliS
MTFNPYLQYRVTAVETAKPVDLVVMLYRGALRFTQQGIHAISSRRIEEAHVALVRAQEIVAELRATIDLEAGGQVARNLDALYAFIGRRLMEANCQKSTAPALEAQEILRELLAAWEALANGGISPSAQPAEGVTR